MTRDDSMVSVRGLIPSEGPPSYISEVGFSPDGRIFGATFMRIDEVRLYDAETLAPLRTLRNPTSGLNEPHGIWLTDKHLILTNAGVRPTQILVYRLDDESGVPIQVYTPPFPHLAEGHSLALHGRRLVVTFSENWDNKGAIVSFDYDDELGRITGPLDIQERWFRRYGDAKGICFNEQGDRVYVTFTSENRDMARARSTIKEFLKNQLSLGYFGRTWRNGIAVFGIDPSGRFTARPLQTRVFDEFVRLENIHVQSNLAAVSNPVGGRVYLYDMKRDPEFKAPSQILAEGLVFPHGVRISPDGRSLVVADYGIEVINRKVQWRCYVSPRKDQLLIYDVQHS